jgi:hypothetical protein
MTLTRLIPALFFAFSIAASAMPPAPTTGTALSGTVLEAKDGGGYTYLRLRTKNGEVWAAVPAAQVKTGAEVSIANPQTMSGFQSKALNRTFDTIIFGTLAGMTAGASLGNLLGKAGQNELGQYIKENERYSRSLYLRNLLGGSYEPEPAARTAA